VSSGGLSKNASSGLGGPEGQKKGHYVCEGGRYVPFESREAVQERKIAVGHEGENNGFLKVLGILLTEKQRLRLMTLIELLNSYNERKDPTLAAIRSGNGRLKGVMSTGRDTLCHNPPYKVKKKR